MIEEHSPHNADVHRVEGTELGEMESKSKRMTNYLYVIQRAEGKTNYDEVEGMVVVAKNPKDARDVASKAAPTDIYGRPTNCWHDSSTSVMRIGTASQRLKHGAVMLRDTLEG